MLNNYYIKSVRFACWLFRSIWLATRLEFAPGLCPIFKPYLALIRRWRYTPFINLVLALEKFDNWIDGWIDGWGCVKGHTPLLFSLLILIENRFGLPVWLFRSIWLATRLEFAPGLCPIFKPYLALIRRWRYTTFINLVLALEKFV